MSYLSRFCMRIQLNTCFSGILDILKLQIKCIFRVAKITFCCNITVIRPLASSRDPGFTLSDHGSAEDQGAFNISPSVVSLSPRNRGIGTGLGAFSLRHFNGVMS